MSELTTVTCGIRDDRQVRYNVNRKGQRRWYYYSDRGLLGKSGLVPTYTTRRCVLQIAEIPALLSVVYVRTNRSYIIATPF